MSGVSQMWLSIGVGMAAIGEGAGPPVSASVFLTHYAGVD